MLALAASALSCSSVVLLELTKRGFRVVTLTELESLKSPPSPEGSR